MAGLSSCAVSDGGSGFLSYDCLAEADAGERLDGVDWDMARTVDVRIRQDFFDPMVINMVENSPTVLRIHNLDNDKHILRSYEFFRSVALDSIKIGDEVDNELCIDAITVPGNSVAEVRMMPVREGRYDFEDSSILVSRLTAAAAIGVFVIESYREHYKKPTPYTPYVVEPVKATPGDIPEQDAPEDAPGMFDGETPEEDAPSLFDGETPEETTEEAVPKPAPGKPQPIKAAPSEPVEKAPVESEIDTGIVVFDDPEVFR